MIQRINPNNGSEPLSVDIESNYYNGIVNYGPLTLSIPFAMNKCQPRNFESINNEYMIYSCNSDNTLTQTVMLLLM